VKTPYFREDGFMIKEIFDRTLAAIGLFVAAPLMALRSSSRSNLRADLHIAGRQERLPSDDKFRKMPHDLNTGPAISPKNDPRLTKVGGVLERLKLDELPQLLNILKGEMSFVGPRPEIPEIVRLYNAEQKKVLAVKPGLFGPNQIVWRNEKNLLPNDLSDVEAYYIEHILLEKLARDLRYVEEQSFFLDLKYFLLAVGVTLFEPLKPVHFMRRKWEILHLAIDLGLCALALAAALLIKYDLNLSAVLWRQALAVLPILLFWQMIAFVFLGIYQQIWSYASKEDLLMIMKAILLATALAGVTVYAFGKVQFPASVFILDAILYRFYRRHAAFANLFQTKERPHKRPVAKELHDLRRQPRRRAVLAPDTRRPRT
jgi:lipopolysaccharide/colanic/teichoic acid biosynthesis glycosyltransferase